MFIVVVVVAIFPQIMTQSGDRDAVADKQCSDKNGAVFSAVEVDDDEMDQEDLNGVDGVQLSEK